MSALVADSAQVASWRGPVQFEEVERGGGEGGRGAAPVGCGRDGPQGRHPDAVAASFVAHHPAPSAYLQAAAVFRRPQHHRAGAGHHHDARAAAEGVVEGRLHVRADPHRACDLLVPQGRCQGAAHGRAAGAGQSRPDRGERKGHPGRLGGAADGVGDHPGRGGGAVGTHQGGGAFRPAGGRAVAGEHQRTGSGAAPVDARDVRCGHGRGVGATGCLVTRMPISLRRNELAPAPNPAPSRRPR